MVEEDSTPQSSPMDHEVEPALEVPSMEAIEAPPLTAVHPAKGSGSLGPSEVQPSAKLLPQSVAVCGPSAPCQELKKWPGALWDAPKGTATVKAPEGSMAHVASPATFSPVPTAALPERGRPPYMGSEEEEEEETGSPPGDPQCPPSYLPPRTGAEPPPHVVVVAPEANDRDVSELYGLAFPCVLEALFAP